MTRSGFRVLLVEDDVVDREMVHRLIDGSHQLSEANTLQAAQASVAESPPDCVLLDQHLPDGSGLQLLKELVKRRVPVIMLTRHGNEAVAVEAMKLGAKDYLIKGQLREDSLRSSIRFAVEAQRAESNLQADEAKVRAILGAAVDCIIAVDRQARIVDINLAAEAMTGYLKDDVLGRVVYEVLFLVEQRDRVRRNIEGYLGTDQEGSMMRERIELPVVRKDLSTFVAEVVLRPILLHESVALVVFLHDVTRRKNAELALQHTQQDLQARVVERTAELRTAYENLQRESTERQRSDERARVHLDELSRVSRLNTLGEMAAGLAHELNQPLTAIVAHLEASRDTLRSEGNANPEVLDDLHKSIEQAQRAGEIIKRLRAMIGRQPIERTRFEIRDAVKEVVSLVARDAKSLGVRIVVARTHDLQPILGDRIQIEQVILNLLRNALEELQNVPEAERQLSIVISMTEEGHANVRVKDSGRGNSPETLQRLFEPFYTTKPGGLGLGLSISRSIVESHRGSLTAQPNPDRGLTMSFTLPAESVVQAPLSDSL